MDNSLRRRQSCSWLRESSTTCSSIAIWILSLINNWTKCLIKWMTYCVPNWICSSDRTDPDAAARHASSRAPDHNSRRHPRPTRRSHPLLWRRRIPSESAVFVPRRLRRPRCQVTGDFDAFVLLQDQIPSRDPPAPRKPRMHEDEQIVRVPRRAAS